MIEAFKSIDNLGYYELEEILKNKKKQEEEFRRKYYVYDATDRNELLKAEKLVNKAKLLDETLYLIDKSIYKIQNKVKLNNIFFDVFTYTYHAIDGFFGSSSSVSREVEIINKMKSQISKELNPKNIFLKLVSSSSNFEINLDEIGFINDELQKFFGYETNIVMDVLLNDALKNELEMYLFFEVEKQK